MRAMHILLVEDNPADVELTEISLEYVERDSKQSSHLHVATDGLEALEFLHQQGRHTDAPRPDIILLDLNLPRKNGRQVLAEIKADDNLKSIPVAVLSSSQSDSDIRAAYELHSNCYLRKPASLTEFQNLMESLHRFWLELVRLPPRD